MINLNEEIKAALDEHFNSDVKVWQKKFLANGEVYKYKIKHGKLSWKKANYVVNREWCPCI